MTGFWLSRVMLKAGQDVVVVAAFGSVNVHTTENGDCDTLRTDPDGTVHTAVAEPQVMVPVGVA